MLTKTSAPDAKSKRQEKTRKDNRRNYRYVGRRIIREDSIDKVRGAYRYLADQLPQDVLIGIPLLSSQPNAIVKSIDPSEVQKTDGVIVLTFRDVPENKYNSGEWFPGQNDFPDETILRGHARHVGDHIGLVLAPDEKTARRALLKIKVEYEALPPIVDIVRAEEMSGLLHEDGMTSFPGHIEYGDVDAAFAAAAHIESDDIYTQKIHHAALEPHCVLAIPRPEHVIEVHTPCQILFGVQHAISQVLPLPLSKIRVIKVNMGGSFGGKQECVFEPLCAWAAWKLRRPVFINTNRTETMAATRTRAAMLGRVTTALDSSGRILARKFDVTADAGAYLTGTKKVMMAMGKKASRLYRIPALRFEGRVVRTSTTPGGACRGYGSPQIHTITEIHTDLMCRRLGLDPFQFRLDNLVHDGDHDPSGASDIGRARIIECLREGASRFGWPGCRHPLLSEDGRYSIGAGFACSTHGNGYYKTIYHDMVQMSFCILPDGSAILRTPLHELGNGTTTAVAQIAAEASGIDIARITVTEGDTNYSSFDAGCQASRVIYVCGECARRAATDAVRLLCREASEVYGGRAEFHDGFVLTGEDKIELGEAVRRIMTEKKRSIEAHCEYAPDKNPASFGVHFAEVTVDRFTGLVQVNRYLAVHDIGQSINRNFVEVQIYGGIQMGIGMALCEELEYGADGMPKARNFDKYHMINMPDMPDVDVMLIEDEEPGGPYGAKSIGEICTVPVAAAVVNAVNRALGTSLTYLPLTPPKIISALKTESGEQ